jgi:hypothetical protein
MNRIGKMEYRSIGKKRLLWGNLAARKAWNSSVIMDENAVTPTTFHHSTIPLFHSWRLK